MNGDPSQFEELIEAYLDEQLAGDAKAQFERTLSGRPELRAQLDRYRARQTQINASLRRMFVAPTAPSGDFVKQIDPSRNGHETIKLPTAPPPPRVRRSLLIAASIAILVCGPVIAWYAWQSYNAPATVAVYKPQPVRPLDDVYRERVKSGFQCDWECKTEREFAATFAAQLGQPLLMHALPDQVTSLGLSYAGGITPRSVAYLAKVSGQPVMVFVDREQLDKGQSLSSPQGLHIFKRQVGALVLYEVTPHEKPDLLDLFFMPQTSANGRQDGPARVFMPGAATRKRGG